MPNIAVLSPVESKPERPLSAVLVLSVPEADLAAAAEECEGVAQKLRHCGTDVTLLAQVGTLSGIEVLSLEESRPPQALRYYGMPQHLRVYLNFSCRLTICSTPDTEAGGLGSLDWSLLVTTASLARFRKMAFCPCTPCADDLLLSSAPARQRWAGTDPLKLLM